MNFRLIPTERFEKDVRHLRRKYKRIRTDLVLLEQMLMENPREGVSLGNDCYKIRLPNSSIPTGKSGGFRIIIYVKIERDTVFLLTMYSKTEKEDVPDSELRKILASLGESG